MKFVALDLIDNYEKNARIHPEEQLATIMRLMIGTEENPGIGWTIPALIEECGSRYGMLAGHGRKEIARRCYASGKVLWMSDGTEIPFGTIPVLFARDWSEEQKRAYIIADNQLPQMASWDEDLLAAELATLEDAGFDLSLLGFNADDLENWLLEDEPNFLTHEDECPDLPAENPRTQLGDIWALGDHRLICGSSTEPETLHALLASAGVERAGSWYICFYRLGIDGLFDAIKASGMKWRNLIIWQKGQLTLSNSDYKSTYEPIIYGWEDDYLPVMYGWNDKHKFYGPKGEIDNWKLEEGLLSIWEITRTRHNDLHPTMKPVALCERAIHNSSRRHQVVLDLFGGSGSTLIAAEKSGRRACLVELDAAYCDVIVKRYEEYTGKHATLLKQVSEVSA